MYILTVKGGFSAAHALREYEGECEELHGHNWNVEVTVQTEGLDDVGLGVDFRVMKNVLKSELDPLDHKFLNEVEPFDRLNPSSENLARYLFEQLSSKLNRDGVKVVEVAVGESQNVRAAYRAE